ncbi:TIGR00341 family protein [Streptomyces sp. MN3]
MIGTVRTRVLPASQRSSLDELTEDLDLSSGDTTSERSAFWTMLTLSSVIASGGVLTDSTATVIGAMIIAPLFTPIMGIALGSVQRRRTGSARVVLLACLRVTAVGMAVSVALPSDYDLLSNSQISSRTSPGLMDLIAALATGFAGAVALARRDVAAVLPGVAIAISCVPPLVVAGVCLGQLSGWLALGALVLFVSNLFALVFGGMVVFASLGYGTEADKAAGRPARRTYAAMILLFTAVFVPLTANTVITLLLDTWTGRTKGRGTAVACRRAGRVRHERRRDVPDDIRPRPQPRRPPAGGVSARPARGTDPGRYPRRGGHVAWPAHRRRSGRRLSILCCSPRSALVCFPAACRKPRRPFSLLEPPSTASTQRPVASFYPAAGVVPAGVLLAGGGALWAVGGVHRVGVGAACRQ